MAEGYSKLRNELVSAASGVGYAYQNTGAATTPPDCDPAAAPKRAAPSQLPGSVRSRVTMSSALVRQPQPNDADIFPAMPGVDDRAPLAGQRGQQRQGGAYRQVHVL